LIAKGNGSNVMEYARDVYGHYEESVATTRQAWAMANEEKLVGYIKGYVAAVEWLRHPENKEEAISILRKYFPQLSPELAAATYSNFVSPRGIAAKAQLDLAGVRKVLELRSEYARPKKSLTNPTRYYDPKYYEAAIR
jgi:ABC-type nitrate/sulfonate/bicarbonate transport system substrate-binding protein